MHISLVEYCLGSLRKSLPSKLLSGLIVCTNKVLGMEVGHSWNHFEQFSPKDIHTRNLAFTMPSVDDVPEEEFMEMLGKPEIGYVRRSDGKSLEPGIPKYILRPTSYQTLSLNPTPSIKVIDFGEAFLRTTVPQTLHPSTCSGTRNHIPRSL